jgi:hypothetical protein
MATPVCKVHVVDYYINIATYKGCAWLMDGVWNGWLDLLTGNTALSLIYTLYSSPMHAH